MHGNWPGIRAVGAALERIRMSYNDNSIPEWTLLTDQAKYVALRTRLSAAVSKVRREAGTRLIAAWCTTKDELRELRPA